MPFKIFYEKRYIKSDVLLQKIFTSICATECPERIHFVPRARWRIYQCTDNKINCTFWLCKNCKSTASLESFYLYIFTMFRIISKNNFRNDFNCYMNISECFVFRKNINLLCNKALSITSCSLWNLAVLSFMTCLLTNRVASLSRSMGKLILQTVYFIL